LIALSCAARLLSTAAIEAFAAKVHRSAPPCEIGSADCFNTIYFLAEPDPAITALFRLFGLKAA
jgi:hypothetical protein